MRAITRSTRTDAAVRAAAGAAGPVSAIAPADLLATTGAMPAALVRDEAAAG